MKNTHLIIIVPLILYCACITAQERCLNAMVDERIELTSICQRLMGAKEYNRCDLTPYTDDIDTYFADYKDHPLLSFLHKMRYEKGVNFGTIPMSAVLLDIKNGHVRLNPESDVEARKALYDLWDEQSHNEYIRLLDDFYRKSNFRSFFKKHAALYKKAEMMFDSIYNIDTKWFENTYGMPFGKKTIYLGITNGWSNYGLPHTGDVVVGGFYYDKTYKDINQKISPRMCLNNGAETTVIHEITHTFVNENIAKYSAAACRHIERFMPKIDTLLKKSSYGSAEAVWFEWVTRLGTYLYFRDHVPENAVFKSSYYNSLVRKDEKAGFIWQERSVNFLRNYINNKDIYVTFLDFVPQLVGYIGFVANNFDEVLTEYKNSSPYVLAVYPAPGTLLNTSSDSITITVTFSEKMSMHCQGFQLLSRNKEYFSSLKKNDYIYRGYWDDEWNYVIKLNVNDMKGAKIYGIKYIRSFMQDQFAHSMKNDFIVEYELPQ